MLLKRYISGDYKNNKSGSNDSDQFYKKFLCCSCTFNRSRKIDDISSISSSANSKNMLIKITPNCNGNTNINNNFIKDFRPKLMTKLKTAPPISLFNEKLTCCTNLPQYDQRQTISSQTDNYHYKTPPGPLTNGKFYENGNIIENGMGYLPQINLSNKNSAKSQMSIFSTSIDQQNHINSNFHNPTYHIQKVMEIKSQLYDNISIKSDTKLNSESFYGSNKSLESNDSLSHKFDNLSINVNSETSPKDSFVKNVKDYYSNSEIGSINGNVIGDNLVENTDVNNIDIDIKEVDQESVEITSEEVINNSASSMRNNLIMLSMEGNKSLEISPRNSYVTSFENNVQILTLDDNNFSDDGVNSPTVTIASKVELPNLVHSNTSSMTSSPININPAVVVIKSDISTPVNCTFSISHPSYSDISPRNNETPFRSTPIKNVEILQINSDGSSTETKCEEFNFEEDNSSNDAYNLPKNSISESNLLNLMEQKRKDLFHSSEPNSPYINKPIVNNSISKSCMHLNSENIEKVINNSNEKPESPRHFSFSRDNIFKNILRKDSRVENNFTPIDSTKSKTPTVLSKRQNSVRNSSKLKISKTPYTTQINPLFRGEIQKPFDKPRESFNQIMCQLNNTADWEMNITGLKNLLRLFRYHGNLIENQTHIIVVALSKHIRSLRSQVARTACCVSSELFVLFKKHLELDIEEIASALLHRTADTNKFLRKDANGALDSMCQNMPITRIINVICARGSGHQNAIVRCTSARLLLSILKPMGSDKLFQLPKECRDKFLITSANLLTEGSLETRNHAKEIFRILLKYPTGRRILLEVIPPNLMRQISKTINSLV